MLEHLAGDIQRAPRHAVRAKTDFSIVRNDVLHGMLQDVDKQAKVADYDYILCGMGTLKH